ncbi:hypothetical protein BDV95DRAFT_480418 [Massariosphaeria phaeospora]|uniref:Uncharacterized protein n=1 Tax=Massariosphaeria phaeospora TaxID=100035 RepID=A0A7C8IF98_9PLEO|nr:hypothetical protein BDV95DRAFT_480418 [Massariosphaeria phaeospora]
MAPTITVAPLTANDAASANLGATNKKHGNQFLTEEDHLLIYLKEVKKVKWRDIEAYFPGRKWHALQSRYSTKLNKRDRAQDPPTFTLPAQFANEALTDANAVQQDTTGAIQTLTMDAATVFQALPQSLPRTSRALPIATAAPEPPPVEDSSANESGPARRRPRRVEHAPNFYTWPRRNGLAHAVDDIVGAEIDSPEPETMSDASVETPPIPDKAIPVENDPMAVDFDEENAAIALATERCNRSTASGQKLPYLSSSQRLLSKNTSKDWEWEQLDSREWQGYVVHVDFSPTEMVLVELVMAKVLGVRSLARSTQRRFLQKSLKTLTEPKLVQLSHEIRRRLPARDQNDVDAFVEDARQGKLHENPRVERIGAARPGRHFSSDPKTSISARLRQREVGLCSRRGWAASSRPITYQLQNNLQDSLGPAYSYTGASSDVHTVAWSPDGQCFAAGAVCVTDPHSMQYNRRNNLLYGDISTNTMHELGEHYLDREKTETGPNSTHAMHISQDPKLYTTISSVAFSPDGRFMFSAGYDSTACVWKTSPDGQPGFLRALKHKAEVDMLTVSCEGKLATAAKKWTTNAVKVLTMNEDDPSNVQKQNYTSQKAGQRPDLNILPTALQFEPRYGRLLLAGFGANQCTDRLDTNGDICLWDVETTQQLSVHGSGKNVFDVAWNPYQRVQPLFMIGCVAGQNVNRGTRSLLRFYDGYGFGKYSMNMEIECKALDMNDIIFCPHDETLVAAGCTNGRAYVWDIRRPDQLLCELAHGKSLMPLDDFVDREITDTGIRFLSWGTNATRLYSGSSDGVVKVWDVVRSEKDVFIKDLITTDSGIMSGAFSPDYSRLILGEVNGSINVLEVGREDYSIRDMNKFKYCPYQDPDEDQTEIEATISADSGKAAAIALLADSKMMQVPMGGLPIFQAVQGPNYDGPYDQSVDAPFLREQALEFQHNLSVSSGPQCDIAACRDVVKVTAEEIGDSGRSTDRIPDELRKQFMALGSGVAVLPPGKSKCTRCGRPARPAFDSVATMLCERCSFTCFRCGASNPVMPDTAIFACQSCERIWDIGVLGYECVQESRKPMDIATDVPSLRAPSKKKNALDDNVSFGDELNAFTDYYFSLAIDRPLSPPL